ncbi:MAG: hypothetical protein M3550_06275 [Actinomycetota bacterium]|nr:hypothetical protein [Actinomycetota bacterium]
MEHLLVARDASNTGYSVTFLAVTALALIAGALVAWLVRAPKTTDVDPAVRAPP